MISNSRVLQWIRWIGLIICLAVGFSALQDQPTGKLRPFSVWLLADFSWYVLYGALWLWNTRAFREQGRYNRLAFLVQMVVGVKLVLELSTFSVVTIGLVARPDKRRRWIRLWILLATAFLSWEVFLHWGHWRAVFSALEPEDTSVWVGVVGLAEIVAWNIFAYYAACFLVDTESDRRKLALANQELLALQAGLSESSRFEERLRLSRELHDSMGHYLTSQSIQLEIASFHATEAVKEPVGRALLLGRLMLSEIRDAVNTWQEERSTVLSPAIRQLAEGVAGVQVNCEIDEDLPVTSPNVSHTIFRCAQEAVTNTLRHAKAKNLWLSLKRVDNEIQLEVRDDGRGCDTVDVGNGLNGLRSRAAQLNGRLSLESSRGQGFRMLLAVPASNWEPA